MIKKAFLFGTAALMLSSCQTILNTARTEDVESGIANFTVADLDVYPERVTETIAVDAELRRGGEANVKHAVEAEALRKNGRGDLLVEPQYVIKKKRTFLGNQITEISVSGRPASFKNFRSLNDSVWSNPVFRGVNVTKHFHQIGKPSTSTKTNATQAVQEDEEVKAKPNWRPRGITSSIELGGFGYPAEEGMGFDITYSLGYQFNRNWFVGVGTGYIHSFEDYHCEGFSREYGYKWDDEFRNTELRTVPLFAQVRWYMTRKKVSPYFDAKIGYAFSCYNTLEVKKYWSSYSHDVHVKDNSYFGGAYLRPALGVAFSTKKGQTIDFSVTYNPSQNDLTLARVGASVCVTF